ncbi:hypothetical protein L210DRAFT_151054 [Boletus edulis BED1]|uniref:Uncharacterized protein n=1 Tax=Boletus edulis BED1 TaxID=1328754 RepID=A0AAD4G675_BOLED|nr:hypothetical protein L210DRAFT_151054 [Boletus edulis BED1]
MTTTMYYTPSAGVDLVVFVLVALIQACEDRGTVTSGMLRGPGKQIRKVTRSAIAFIHSLRAS